MKTRLRTFRQKRRLIRERRRALGPLNIQLTQQEILEDLFWPHPAPGQWEVPPLLRPVEDEGDQPLRPAA